jgi:hypothetical protein
MLGTLSRTAPKPILSRSSNPLVTCPKFVCKLIAALRSSNWTHMSTLQWRLSSSKVRWFMEGLSSVAGARTELMVELLNLVDL